MGKSGQNCMQCASNDRTTYINKNGTLKLHYPTSDKFDYKPHGAHHSEKYDVFPVLFQKVLTEIGKPEMEIGTNI